MDVPDNAVKITDPDTVKSLVVAQGHIQLIKRVCSSCVDSHKLIYYRRFTPMPASFDLYNNLMDDWFNTDNVLDVDFGLYSIYMDAIHDWDRWTFCNYNDPTVGFPRDCGPEGYVANNWNGSHGSGRTMPSLSCHQSAAVQVPPFDMERSSSFEQRSRPQEQRLSQEGSQGLVGIQQSIP